MVQLAARITRKAKGERRGCEFITRWRNLSGSEFNFCRRLTDSASRMTACRAGPTPASEPLTKPRLSQKGKLLSHSVLT